MPVPPETTDSTYAISSREYQNVVCVALSDTVQKVVTIVGGLLGYTKMPQVVYPHCPS